MLAFSQNNRKEMIDILIDLEFTYILRPVYEAQVCYLILKYAVALDREQQRYFATKVKITSNNIIYKEDLVQGSNAWQYYHDSMQLPPSILFPYSDKLGSSKTLKLRAPKYILIRKCWLQELAVELEADDRLEIWEAKQRVIDEQENILQGLVHEAELPRRTRRRAAEEAAAKAAKKAFIAEKAKEQQNKQRQRVLDSQATFYMTYEVCVLLGGIALASYVSGMVYPLGMSQESTSWNIVPASLRQY